MVENAVKLYPILYRPSGEINLGEFYEDFYRQY